MDFQHSEGIWRDFPELVPGVIFADGITHDVPAGDRAARFTAIARSRLDIAVFDVSKVTTRPEVRYAAIAPTAAVLSQSAPRFAFQK